VLSQPRGVPQAKKPSLSVCGSSEANMGGGVGCATSGHHLPGLKRCRACPGPPPLKGGCCRVYARVMRRLCETYAAPMRDSCEAQG